MSVFHPEPTRNYSQLLETKALVQMTGVNIRCHNSIELKNSESVFSALQQAVLNQLFPYMQSARLGTDGIACVADMTAPANIVWMENIQSIYFAVGILRHSAVGLRIKKYLAGILIKKLLLWKRTTFFNNFIPDSNHIYNIFWLIFSYRNYHVYSLKCK